MLPSMLTNKTPSGGAYLSFFLDQLSLPYPIQDPYSTILCVSVVNTAKWNINSTGADSNDSTSLPQIRSADLVEEPIIFRPVSSTRDEKDYTKMRYGAIWNMQ